MEAEVSWSGLPGMSFVATTGSGHMLCMDGAPDGGGNNLAPRPMEVVLALPDPSPWPPPHLHGRQLLRTAGRQ